MSKIFHHTPPLPQYTPFGGYPIAYYAGKACDFLCAKCATEAKHKAHDPEVSAWEREAVLTPLLCDVHWEGEALVCEECGREVESAYGPVDG